MSRSRLPLAAILVLPLLVLSLYPSARAADQHRGRKYKAPPQMALIQVTVVRASSGKPIRNAAVVFHPMKGDKNEGNMELKTNEKGEASIHIVPVGSKVLLQVIAQGYRTFGKQYDIASDKKTITVKMLPPDDQYSLYEKHDPNTDIQTNTPHTQMGQAAPADSPLLTPPAKKH